MSKPTAVFEFTDEEISSETDLGSSRMKWKAIKKIWRFPEAWLLFITEWQYITLPIADLTDEIRQFILVKVQEQGGKVD
jgi:hypothetical protein